MPPDNAYAAEYENGFLGKTEMWYVLDAEKGAQIFYGFSHDVTRWTLEKNLRDGTVEKYLQKILAKQDDVYFIKAGTVHEPGRGRIGGGNPGMLQYHLPPVRLWLD